MMGESYYIEKESFISMRVTIPWVVHAILAGEKDVMIDGVYTLQSELTEGKRVFLVLGGDKGSREVDWETGFYAVAHVSRQPYDIGYEKSKRSNYFRFDVHIDCAFSRPVPREEFLLYREAYDAVFIGPELHRDPTQAIASLERGKAVAVIRGILDKMPEMQGSFEAIFSEDFMNDVYGFTTKLIPTRVRYGQTDQEALGESVAEERNNYGYRYGREEIPYPHNRILFGAPGTGKSFKLNEEQEEYFRDEVQYERVTFHPAYSYAQFFGSYKPVSEGRDIFYRFVPGPFLRVLLRALLNPGQNFLLIVEEINRADVAAVFGDVFQLLDRTGGRSTYQIDMPEDLRQFLVDSEEYSSLLSGVLSSGKLVIPRNMYIWATMNSADQGVMPLDTAFKRRWRFEYIDIDHDRDKADYKTPAVEDESSNSVVKYKWLEIRDKINACLKATGDITEDRWLGAFFLHEDDFKSEKDFEKVFKSKVLMYLFQDVAKYAEPGAVFAENYLSYSELCKAFDEKGMEIFANQDKG